MADIDYAAARFWLDVAVLIAVAANTAYTWAANRSKVNKAAIAEISNRVGKVEQRMSDLEADVNHLPDRGDIDTLHDRITGVSNQVSEVSGELRGIDRTLQNIHQSLLAERNKP